MTTQPKTLQLIPEGYHSVTPWIISRNTAKLLDFMKQAFRAKELDRQYREAIRSFQDSIRCEMERRSEAENCTEASR